MPCLELRLTRWWSGGLLSLHFQLVAGGKQEGNQSVGNILMFFAAYYLVKKKKGITFASVICHGEASLPPLRHGKENQKHQPNNNAMQKEGLDIKELDQVVVRFSGDSGDGMQLAGNIFSTISATVGNGISTFTDYPADIRAPQGSLTGVSGYQAHIGAG